MADVLAGIYKGDPFTIPASTLVNPVYLQAGGKIWADAGIRTSRDSKHMSFRLLPTDGTFRTFIDKNRAGASHAIVLFEKPIQTNRGTTIGYVVDLRLAHYEDLPF